MSNYPNKGQLEFIRSKFPEGCRIELVSTKDPYTNLKRGDQGTVTFVDDMATIHINWDNGSGLGMVYPVDIIRRIE